MAISALFLGPREPKKFDFSYKPMRMPNIAFWGLAMAKKGVSIAILLSAVTKFLPFFEAKMTKINILNLKLIVSDDYQHFWVHYEWF